MDAGSPETSGGPKGKKKSRSLGLKQLQDVDAAWKTLTSRNPDSLEDESFLPIALQDWILKHRSAAHQLERLAQALEINHKDAWLGSFLHSRSSPSSIRLLVGAIDANHSGDANAALRLAIRARQIFLRERNPAGALRSQFEQVYALRRLSRPLECEKEASALSQAAQGARFQWIQIQTTIENSSCEGMQGGFDTAWFLATEARNLSSSTGYRILHLRALGLLGNLDMVEGRSDASWLNNGKGLAIFWQGIYPDERAFQLYYNLEVDAERTGADYLAIILQRETLNMIAGQSRFDFEAMAHFRMAQAADRAGDHETARREMLLYSDLIAKLPDSPAKNLYQAYCEIGLAGLAAHSASLQQSREHLEKARPAVSTTGNAMLQLEYLKAAADVDRLSGEPKREQLRLEEITEIGANAFASLKSVLDRWRWRQVVGDAYRRLLEIKLSSQHSPEHVFQFWQRYHELESASPVNQAAIPSEMAIWEKLTIHHLERLHDSTLISYAVLPDSVAAWVVDDRGVREFALPVQPGALKREALDFYLMCSDPNSAIEKVDASGSRLYQWLIAPLEQALEPGRTLNIDPDTSLSFMPWAALKRSNGAFLGSSWAMVIEAGLNTRSRDRERHEVKNATIAVPDSLELNGQPFMQLPNAEQEAAELKRLYPKTKELRGGNVTVANVLRELPRTEIFEFAGHAITREHGGELVVSGRHGAEILSASRLAGLRLRKTRIVVLAACSTGAEQDADRDPSGLVRTLLNAGAGSVLATRWEVDSDATAKGTEQFFRSFKSGKSKSQALQAAREKLRADNKFVHPYYWAGIDLFGSN